MKKFFLVLFILSFFIKCFSQKTDTSHYSRNYCLQKAGNLKKLGDVCLISGAALFVVGIIANAADYEPIQFVPFSRVLIMSGAGVAFFSIPFYVSSKRYKRMAAGFTVGIGGYPTLSAQNIDLKRQWYPSLGVRVGIR